MSHAPQIGTRSIDLITHRTRRTHDIAVLAIALALILAAVIVFGVPFLIRSHANLATPLHSDLVSSNIAVRDAVRVLKQELAKPQQSDKKPLLDAVDNLQTRLESYRTLAALSENPKLSADVERLVGRINQTLAAINSERTGMFDVWLRVDLLLDSQAQDILVLLEQPLSKNDTVFSQVYYVHLTILGICLLAFVIIIVQMFRNAAALRAAEEELKVLSEHVDRATVEADRAKEAKARFLSAASHELRTPLTSILGFSNMLVRNRSERFDEQVSRDYAAHIHHSGEQLLRIIDDIIELAAAETGELPKTDRATSVASMLREVYDWATSTVGGRGISVGLRLPEQDVGLRLEPRVVGQILQNLISSAAAHTPDGGAITISSGFGSDGHVTISIRDTGPGLPADAVSQVFEPFERSGSLVRHPRTSPGLGLAIVKSLVHRLGAELSVSSTAGRGTVIALAFPRHLISFDVSAPGGGYTASPVGT